MQTDKIIFNVSRSQNYRYRWIQAFVFNKRNDALLRATYYTTVIGPLLLDRGPHRFLLF